MELLEAYQDLSADQLLAMTEHDRLEFVNNLRDLIKYTRTHRLERFSPFPYQQEFMNASASHNIRLLSAANRIGKTFCGAAEMAMHVTGLYPSWYTGKRINGSGRLYWCVGRDLTMVADIQQKELIGTADCRVTEELGTGAIPIEHIITDRSKGWKADGARLERIRIRHVDGGLNTLEFYGSNDPNALMGRMVSAAWCDEESPYSMEIYSQLIARTANAIELGVNGLIYFTATPEEGETQLYLKFSQDKTGSLYFKNVTWWDCPLFNEAQIDQMLAALPPWERDMRSRGLPAKGQGAVFKVSDDDLIIDDVYPLPHWQVIIGVDWGHVQDPTVVIVALQDPDTDTYYLYDMFYFDIDEQARSAANIATVLLNSPYANVPVIVPHDSGLDSDASESNGKILRRYGVNVRPEPFRNPPDSQLKITQYNDSNKSVRKIETGLQEMLLMMNEGRFKVCRRCEEWLREKRGYFYKFNLRTRKLDYAGADHCIDASRYAVLSLMGNRGGNWDEAHTAKSWSTADEITMFV
ncbi:hypothetical protein E2L92_21980 [Salmonella enterica subsp. enterica serovar Ibadan]|nr:hypothetical protein [Salmonella enterica subsp. enterica serovar Ibadan]ECF3282122.1 hypothetical protein [Salmonella enterica subsp. enterica serovar Ibadan]